MRIALSVGDLEAPTVGIVAIGDYPTVGFGDLSPSTDASKLFTVGYIVAGIGIIGLYLNHRIERVRRRRERKAGRKQGEDNE